MFNNRGIVLFVVLAAIFMVVLLANVILTIVASQSRLTHHQVSRIQAYYAAKAGVNYAFERLRLGTWTAGAAGSCPAGTPCNLAAEDAQFAATFPGSVLDVFIVLRQIGEAGCQNGGVPPAPPGANACISATARYTYTP